MKIAVTSDSHGSKDRLEKLLTELDREGIHYLIHAGDFAVYGVEEVLAKHPQIETYIALGNADVNTEVLDQVSSLSHCHLDIVVSLTLQGVTIAASHIEGVAENELKDKAHIFIHGHTHRPTERIEKNKIILNPGSLMEHPSYIVLTLPDMKLESRILKVG